MDEIKRTASQVTTDAYADILEISREDVDLPVILIEVLEIGGVNGITYRVLASEDATNWKQLTSNVDSLTEWPVAASGHSYQTLTDAWLNLKVQVKATVGASQGTVRCIISGMG